MRVLYGYSGCLQIFPGVLCAFGLQLGTAIDNFRASYCKLATKSQSLSVGQREIVSSLERAANYCFTGDQRCLSVTIWRHTGLYESIMAYGWPSFDRDV